MSATVATSGPKLTRKDFASDQEVRWCPGCGDYAILAAVQSVFPTLGIPKEKFVVVSGIGCSSRFPYYMNTFGFHSIHGRAPAVATGIKLTDPDLSVWVVTGDGDALSIGGNHFIHMMRRNLDIKVLMFNNRIYGLTKGQYSPTSELGKKTKSTPYGSLDRPFHPISLALGAEAAFVARSVDVFSDHLKSVVAAAAEHKGSAFIEILQNCNIFNDGTWLSFTEKDVRNENVLYLEHGKPMSFGTAQPRGLALRGTNLEMVDAATHPQEILVHDVHRPDPMIAFMLSQVDTDRFPLPIGVFRSIEAPTYEAGVRAQLQRAAAKGPGDLDAVLRQADTWEVK
jgi:2-oxoglutarate/2-oxoacid ferredoxin oxidoreductase subunit beta